ncbi:hydrogenase formation protein HypD [Cyanobium sp. T1B-Tous]|uniref:hydrogenase formation protein HypD n=1 Tax=Cyanobium sp. T1B-Tous TaxID=2823721 RepID=UPI0020CDC750|nr:hydrogenase formation protein HypD [Cyanobium sp. T1B-Tous]
MSPAVAGRVTELAAELASTVSRPWTVMEVCGGQTHAILRWGLDQLLPPGLRLIHGPGCPVCVTPAERLDAALALAARPEVILCSYGDMLRVPGSAAGAAGADPVAATDLLGARAAGGDVRLLTSPLEAMALAQAAPDREVVFLAVGFETTAPATALLLRQARALGLANLSVLLAHVRVAPAMEALLLEPANQVQGFLAAGHVGAVMGTAELGQLVERHRVPVVVTGFEPADVMAGLLRLVQLLEAGTPALANAYGRVVRAQGNGVAQALLQEVFVVTDQPWRGLGPIAGGGFALAPAYRHFDALGRLGAPVVGPEPAAASPCISGRILQGRALPAECPAFGRACTPEHPLGAPMVSSEGACAAYYRYRRQAV